MRLTRLASVLMMSWLLAACAGQSASRVVADVDESTGDSFLRPDKPVRLATEQPALSTVGKDYLLVAPVSVSGSVHRGLYLWFAIGTTVDRDLQDLPEPGFDRIVLLVDGMPMTFDLVDWSERARGEPYRMPMKTLRTFASRVTVSQLDRIRSATDVSAWVTNPEHRSPDYLIVRGHPSEWDAF